MATKKNQKLWDVIIVEIATGKVDSIAGSSMQRSTGFHNAEKRMETVLGRINERYTVMIVPAGKVKVGGVIVLTGRSGHSIPYAS
jgi:hypothetical protein